MNIRTLAPICVLSLVACLGTATVAIAGWTGPYGGVTLGGGGSEVEALPVYDPTLILLSNNTLSAGTVLGGATAGYDFQINNIVLGALVEADFGRMKAHGGFNEDDASDIPWGTSASWLASARAKIGTGNDDVMIYGTGGVAFTHARIVGWNYEGFGAENFKLNSVGFVIGAGLEFRINSNWTASFDYSHYDFGSKGNSTQIFSDDGPADGGKNKLTFDVAKVGINYRF
jgi:outer membrane immunogenic protein